MENIFKKSLKTLQREYINFRGNSDKATIQVLYDIGSFLYFDKIDEFFKDYFTSDKKRRTKKKKDKN